jgi:hypothetical protein
MNETFGREVSVLSRFIKKPFQSNNSFTTGFITLFPEMYCYSVQLCTGTLSSTILRNRRAIILTYLKA